MFFKSIFANNSVQEISWWGNYSNRFFCNKRREILNFSTNHVAMLFWKMFAGNLQQEEEGSGVLRLNKSTSRRPLLRFP